ncbi:CYTH and CHAD domain-containing protein [Streptomyces sp. NPDC047108]|uniref:CYTH and CHAD domain-containing protein n=1 Tax=Streptomyces sp. NPDC047108 TaxID=3155025 RepID=UPI0033FF756E
MADQSREIERKYDAPESGLPDLTAVPGVAAVIDQGVTSLDATYYDTEDERLAAAGITLRRRTGGGDEGWHLKLPVETDVREEIRAPLSARVPKELAGLVRSRVRHHPLVPVVRLLSERDVRHLADAEGRLLAEASIDEVTAERLGGGEGTPPRTAAWAEVEVELAEGADRKLLDTIEGVLAQAGMRRAKGPSKLARALAETREPDETGEGGGASAPETTGKGTSKKAKKARDGKKAKAATADAAKGKAPVPGNTAGDHVLHYLRAQVDTIVELDPAVRRDQPDSVHRMRVATRRLRSAFKSFRKVLDRDVTDPIGDELKWLAAELGVDRDREVLTARLYQRLDELPRPLVIGPVRGRLRTWSNARRRGSRRHVIGTLDSARHLDLLDTLDALLADPPLRRAARRPARAVLPGAVLRDFDRLARRVQVALAAPRGHDRDVAVHEARKAAKRARYAAEAARPALGKPAKRLVAHMKNLQDALGDHQDSVVARTALRELALEAQKAQESSFTFGLLYGHEEAQADAREAELPRAWREASRKKLRSALRS